MKHFEALKHELKKQSTHRSIAIPQATTGTGDPRREEDGGRSLQRGAEQDAKSHGG
jgi:hypothetical protein